MEIRHARLEDAAAIAEIYNHYVVHSTATFQEEPDTLAQREAWLKNRKPEHAVIVAEEAGEIIGWAALSEFKGRSAYRYTAENSVYIRNGLTGRGLGKQLMSHLIGLGRRHDMRCFLAVVAADQTPSIRMHEALGFRHCGKLERVGLKFGRWLDIALLQLHLDQ
jgi:L-amino acid N-acyltransferase